MDHHVSIVETGQGRVQAVCSCGWRSPIFGADKTGGTMDALQRGVDAGDLHQWERRCARSRLLATWMPWHTAWACSGVAATSVVRLFV